jgi:[acyl-carrier-protein] S-malonyltransferase
LMPAARRLEQYLAGIAFNAPQISVINNVDVAVASEPQQIKAALARQACSPVRWVEVIRRMAHEGVTHVAECGPGRVLAGLTKRIEDSLQGMAIADAVSLTQAVQAIQQAA